MKKSARFWVVSLSVSGEFTVASIVAADATDKSPSKDMVQWLGSKTSLETLPAQFDYVGGGNTDLGNGVHENIPESQVTIRQLYYPSHAARFLVRGGLE